MSTTKTTKTTERTEATAKRIADAAGELAAKSGLRVTTDAIRAAFSVRPRGRGVYVDVAGTEIPGPHSDDDAVNIARHVVGQLASGAGNGDVLGELVAPGLTGCKIQLTADALLIRVDRPTLAQIASALRAARNL